MVLSKLFSARSFKSLAVAAALVPVLGAATAEAEVTSLSTSLSNRAGLSTTITANAQAQGNVQYRFAYKEAAGQNWIIFRGWGNRNSVRFNKAMTNQAQGMVKFRIEARDMRDMRSMSKQELFFEEQIRDHYLMPTDIRTGNSVKFAGRQMTLTGLYQGDAPALSFREFFVFHENDTNVTRLGQRTLTHAQFNRDARAVEAFRSVNWTPHRAGKWYIGVKVVWQDQAGRTGTHYHVEELRVRSLINTRPVDLTVDPDKSKIKKPVVIVRPAPKPKYNKRPVLIIKP